MEIRRITGIGPEDTAAAERAFDGIEAREIACCNWPEEFPYAPKVSFRMFHTGERLFLRFDVEERYTAALVTADNGEVWTDSCVEFFIALDGKGYYNFETTCIGRMLLAFRQSRNEGVEHASRETLARVGRYPTLPYGVRFAEREGDNRWSLVLSIPPQALFRHDLQSWDGIEGRMNLYKCGDRLSHPHFLSWRPIKAEKPDFHRPEFFEQIKFATI